MESFLHFFQITSGLDVELFRITFVTSLIIALLVYHKRGNVPIGIIAPGTLLLLFGYPTKLLLVFLISCLVYVSALILQKYIFPNTIFASREKLLIFVFLSIIYSFMGSSLLKLSIEVLTAGAIGIVLPAMIAESLTKAHKIRSLQSFFLATLYTFLFFVVLKLSALRFLTDSYKAYLNKLYPITHVLSNNSILVLYFIFAIATILNFILYRKMKFKSAGLLLGAYLGLLVFQPSQILFISVVITIAFLIMKLIHKYTMLFGYRVFVLSTLVVSTVYALAEQVAFIITKGEFQAFIGLHIAGIVICGLLVSETVQHGFRKVLIGSTITAVFLACLLYSIQTISIATHKDFTIGSLINRTNAQTRETVHKSKKKEKKKEDRHIKHIVKSGENLSMITIEACHSDRLKKSIAQQNHLNDPNTIHAGNVLIFKCDKK